ncbi:MAG: ATP-binding cassette domain-containing protein [Candidatus Adiutrix sp.]|nr:ATP-binding cassette domain-containing protein [Candidatus Adiutrix sp.]
MTNTNLKNAPADVIRAEGLSLRRGGELLLNKLSWRVSRGEHWAVLGANGAGKTLLLKMLTGYLWPTEGRVEILGETLGRVDVRELRRSLGWVAKALEELTPPQTTVLEVILSGPEASLGLYVEPSPEQLRAAEALAGDFGLARLAGREFGLLSSGERQRALLARAAAHKPSILFLDEPMSNLDMAGREQFMALLTKLAAGPDAPTVILTTHNTLEIAPFMTHALFMKDGAEVASGPLTETMRPEVLEAVFGLPLQVERTAAGRYLAYL